MGYTPKDTMYRGYIKSLKSYKDLKSDQLSNLLLMAHSLLQADKNPGDGKKLVSTQKDFIIAGLQLKETLENVSLDQLLTDTEYTRYLSLLKERNKTKTSDATRQKGVNIVQQHTKDQQTKNTSYKPPKGLQKSDIIKMKTAFSEVANIDLFESYPSGILTTEQLLMNRFNNDNDIYMQEWFNTQKDVLQQLPEETTLSELFKPQYRKSVTVTDRMNQNRKAGLLRGATFTHIPTDTQGHRAQISTYKTVGITVWTHKSLLKLHENNNTLLPAYKKRLIHDYYDIGCAIKRSLPKDWVIEEGTAEEIQDLGSYYDYPAYIAYTFILKIYNFDELLSYDTHIGTSNIYDYAGNADLDRFGNYY